MIADEPMTWKFHQMEYIFYIYITLGIKIVTYGFDIELSKYYVYKFVMYRYVVENVIYAINHLSNTR